jgi:hypothetical protein
MDFPFYQCREGTTQIFKRYWTLKNGHTRGFINFLSVLAYIAFLDIRMFNFWFELRVHLIHFKLFGGKYMWVWKPINHACHTWVHHPPWQTHAHCRLDLRLRCCRMFPKKIKKWKKQDMALLFDPDGSMKMVSWRIITNFQILASRISRRSLSRRANPTTAIGR